MLSDPSNIPLCILLIAVLIMLNGIVVTCDTALNTVSRSKVKTLASEHKNKSAERLYKLLDQPFKYRYSNRILNYVFLISGIYFTTQLPYNDFICLAVYFAVAAALGELFPRKLAQHHSMKFALSFSGIQKFMVIILTPLVLILNVIADIFLLMFRQSTKVDEEGFSEDQVMEMLEVGQESGEIKEEGKNMINSIFAFDDELAYEIMTPRTDVFLIDISDPPEEYMDQLMELRYSRIPVCEDDQDNIIGILHIKDYLIKAKEAGFDKVDIRSILRKPYFVPDTKNIDGLFFELQREKQHIAVLIDEYGGFSGIVTMEDIVEEIVGDIDDEYDQEEHVIKKIDDNNYYVDGNVALDDINEELGVDLESENSETIGGLIIDMLGEIPEEGNEKREIAYKNLIFTIISVKERRIEKVKIHIEPPEDDENNDKADEADDD